MTSLAQVRSQLRTRDGSRTPAAGDLVGRLVTWSIMATLALVSAFPLYFVLVTATKTEAEYVSNPLGPPTSPTMAALTEAWVRADVGRYALNSLVVVLAACVGLVVVASLMGFATTHLDFPFRNSLLAVTVALMMVPSSVIMIPLFRRIVAVGMLNTYTGLVLVYIGLQAPFSIYMMSSYFRSLPEELLDAAHVDGAGSFRAFWSIALPLARPALLTLLTLNFLWLWNDLLYALLLMQDAGRRTLMVGIALLPGQHGADIPLITAGLAFAMAPPLLMFALFHRQLVEGLTAGAVK